MEFFCSVTRLYTSADEKVRDFRVPNPASRAGILAGKRGRERIAQFPARRVPRSVGKRRGKLLRSDVNIITPWRSVGVGALTTRREFCGEPWRFRRKRTGRHADVRYALAVCRPIAIYEIAEMLTLPLRPKEVSSPLWNRTPRGREELANAFLTEFRRNSVVGLLKNKLGYLYPDLLSTLGSPSLARLCYAETPIILARVENTKVFLFKESK